MPRDGIERRLGLPMPAGVFDVIDHPDDPVTRPVEVLAWVTGRANGRSSRANRNTKARRRRRRRRPPAAVRGVPTAPDQILVEIVDQVYLPLIRGHQPTIP